MVFKKQINKKQVKSEFKCGCMVCIVDCTFLVAICVKWKAKISAMKYSRFVIIFNILPACMESFEII